MTLFIISSLFRAGQLVFSPWRACLGLGIMVVANFINPYKTADFLSFIDKEEAKKTDNSLVEAKGYLIQAHIREHQQLAYLSAGASNHKILITSHQFTPAH